MLVEAIEHPMVEGDVVARKGEVAGLIGNRCFRCGRDPDIAHDSGHFCPAFADYREVGRWIPFSNIVAALRKVRSNIVVIYTSRMEETEGLEGCFHRAAGIYDDGKYMVRMDHPNCPEYSLWELPEPHTMLYKGWRCAIREFLQKTHTWNRREIVERALSIELDVNTEEDLRTQSGFL